MDLRADRTDTKTKHTSTAHFWGQFYFSPAHTHKQAVSFVNATVRSPQPTQDATWNENMLPMIVLLYCSTATTCASIKCWPDMGGDDKAISVAANRGSGDDRSHVNGLDEIRFHALPIVICLLLFLTVFVALFCHRAIQIPLVSAQSWCPGVDILPADNLVNALDSIEPTGDARVSWKVSLVVRDVKLFN